MAGTKTDQAAADKPADEMAALVAQNADLRRENDRLRAELERTGHGAAAAERAGLEAAAANTPREVNGIQIPDGVFLSQGMRDDLERTGRTTDPNTGRRIGNWPKDDAAERNASTGPDRGF